MVASVRQKTDIPLVFMTYLNPVHYYGYDTFFKRCSQVGLNGIIIPDLPYDEKGEVADVAEAYGIDLISMIAPTSEQRIQMIAKEGKGFLYIVSSLGVTGVRSNITTDLNSIMKLVKEAADCPAAIGFGINTPEQAQKMSQIADSVIVGGAIVKIIQKYGADAAKPLYDYVHSMKKQYAKYNLLNA